MHCTFAKLLKPHWLYRYMGMHWTWCILLWIRCATAAIGSRSKRFVSRNYGFVLMIFHYYLNILPENYLITSECIWEIARMNGLLHLLHIWVNGYIKYLQFKMFHFLHFFLTEFLFAFNWWAGNKIGFQKEKFSL